MRINKNVQSNYWLHYKYISLFLKKLQMSNKTINKTENHHLSKLLKLINNNNNVP